MTTKIITIKQTKNIVRSIEPKIPKKYIERVNNIELYYGGMSRFGWFKQNREPKGWVKVGIRLRAAYVEEEKGLKRMNLLGLDKVFYQVINNSVPVKKEIYINHLEKKRLKEINDKLKLSSIDIDTSEKRRYLRYMVDLTEQNKLRSNFRGLDGFDMSRKFFKFMEDLMQNTRGMYEESSENKMVILIEEQEIDRWDYNIEVFEEHDNYIAEKEREGG